VVTVLLMICSGLPWSIHQAWIYRVVRYTKQCALPLSPVFYRFPRDAAKGGFLTLPYKTKRTSGPPHLYADTAFFWAYQCCSTPEELLRNCLYPIVFLFSPPHTTAGRDRHPGAASCSMSSP